MRLRCKVQCGTWIDTPKLFPSSIFGILSWIHILTVFIISISSSTSSFSAFSNVTTTYKNELTTKRRANTVVYICTWLDGTLVVTTLSPSSNFLFLLLATSSGILNVGSTCLSGLFMVAEFYSKNSYQKSPYSNCCYHPRKNGVTTQINCTLYKSESWITLVGITTCTIFSAFALSSSLISEICCWSATASGVDSAILMRMYNKIIKYISNSVHLVCTVEVEKQDKQQSAPKDEWITKIGIISKI